MEGRPVPCHVKRKGQTARFASTKCPILAPPITSAHLPKSRWALVSLKGAPESEQESAPRSNPMISKGACLPPQSLGITKLEVQMGKN